MLVFMYISMYVCMYLLEISLLNSSVLCRSLYPLSADLFDTDLISIPCM